MDAVILKMSTSAEYCEPEMGCCRRYCEHEMRSCIGYCDPEIGFVKDYMRLRWTLVYVTESRIRLLYRIL